MNNRVRTDAVTVMGITPEDPDQIPIEAPNGFIWMTGGALGGRSSSYGLVDVRVACEGRTLDFVMNFGDVLSLRDLVDQVLESMRISGARDAIATPTVE